MACPLDVHTVFERVSVPGWSALLPWKMNISAVSSDGSMLFLGEGADLAVYPLDRRTGHICGARVTIVTSQRQSDAINYLRCGWRGYEPILCVVFMNGLVRHAHYAASSTATYIQG